MPAPVSSTRTSNVTLPQIGGFSGSIQTSRDFTSSSTQVSDGGVTTFTVETKGSLGRKIDGSGHGATVSIGEASHTSSKFSVSVPDDKARAFDPKAFNPLDPSALPVGGSLVIQGSRNGESALKAAFRKLSFETRTTSSAQTSLRVDKLTTTTVRVTAAPTAVFDRLSKLGLTHGKLSAFVLAGERLEGEALKSTVLDLSTPAGQQAYRALLADGAFPARTGPGVTALATMEKVAYRHENGLSINGRDFWFGNKTAGQALRTRHADGTVDVTASLQYAGGVPLTLTRRWNPDGSEALDKRQFDYALPLKTNQVWRLTELLTGTRPNQRLLKEGRYTLRFTDAQLKTLFEATKRAYRANPGVTHLKLVSQETDHVAFGMALVRLARSDAESFINRLADIDRGQNGEWRDTEGTLPGTLIAP